MHSEEQNRCFMHFLASQHCLRGTFGPRRQSVHPGYGARFDVRNFERWPRLDAEVFVEEERQDDWEHCAAELQQDLPGYASLERCEARQNRAPQPTQS